MLDIPFARKVLEYAQKEHDDFKFRMAGWIDTNAHWLDESGQSRCGTAACLAGTAAWIHPDVTPPTDPWGEYFTYQGSARHVSGLGKELLGLTEGKYLDDDGDPEVFYMNDEEALETLGRYITEAEAEEARNDQ